MCLGAGGLLVKNHVEVEKKRTLLDKDGVETDATVFRKEKQRETTRSSTGKTSVGRRRYRSNYLFHLRYDANSDKGIISFNKALRGEAQDFDLTFDYRTMTISVGESTYRDTEIGEKFRVKYLPSKDSSADAMIVEVLTDTGKYHENYRLFYGIALFLLGGLCAILCRQYYKTGTTW